MSAARKLAREYELVYILRPTVTPSEARKVADRVSDVIGRLDAKLTRVDNWGKRKLAYTIKTSAGRFTRGIFILVKYAGFDGAVAEIERNLRLLDDVLRFQTIVLDTTYELSELSVDPDEVEFKDIETTDDEDEDPTFEETLGMKPRPPRQPREDAKNEGDDGDEKAAEGDEAEGKKAEGKKAEGDEKSGDAESEGDDAAAAKSDSSTEEEE